jgi:hypothetical protein
MMEFGLNFFPCVDPAERSPEQRSIRLFSKDAMSRLAPL